MGYFRELPDIAYQSPLLHKNSSTDYHIIKNIFRRSKYVLPIIESAVKINAKAIWMQDGVINQEAYEAAKNAGLLVVMNDCILRRHQEMDRDLQ